MKHAKTSASSTRNISCKKLRCLYPDSYFVHKDINTLGILLIIILHSASFHGHDIALSIRPDGTKLHVTQCGCTVDLVMLQIQ